MAIPCPACGGDRSEPHARARDLEYRSSDKLFDYRRCATCAAVFIDPPPIDRLADIYPPAYYAFRPADPAPLAQRIKERLDARLFRSLLGEIAAPRLRLLDIGGGAGWMLSVARRADPRVAVTHEVDLDASARAAAEAAGHVFHAVPIERFESDERFELILMLNILEHVADPPAVLRRAAALLAPGGRILLKTPNTDTLDHRLFRHHNWGGYHCPRHWVLFTADNLTSTARRAGLAPRWIRYTQGAPQWTTSLLGLLAARGWITVTRERPMHTHPLFMPLAGLTAALDFARLPFMKTAQMFALLEPAPAEGGGPR